MDTRFQVLFHSPLRGAFHLSLTVLLRYRSPGVFSLGGWSPLIPPGFLVSRGTWDHSPRSLSAFAYRAFTFCGPPSQVVRLTDWFFTPRRVGSHARLCPTTPTQQRLPASTLRGFGLLPFRSPLLRESRLISPPPATEMFHFAGLPSIPYLFQVWMMCFRTSGFPIRRSWAFIGCRPLTQAFRSLPRPSSAPGAKASTVCPFHLLTFPLPWPTARVHTYGGLPHKGNATSGERSLSP